MKPRRLGALLYLLALITTTSALANDLEKDPQWVKAVRGSGSYQAGMRNVREYIDKAYDIGALKGAAHWEDIHVYFISLARAKGCQRGKAYAEGPVKACHKVTEKEPSVTGPDYRAGLTQVTEVADDTHYPGRVRIVLTSLYDYGYVQGMKHGLRVHNDDIRLAQTYYKSCMARATSNKGEKACATGSKEWSEAQVARLKKRIEAHGLPAGAMP